MRDDEGQPERATTDALPGANAPREDRVSVLSEEDARFRAIVDAAPDALVVTDRTGRAIEGFWLEIVKLPTR